MVSSTSKLPRARRRSSLFLIPCQPRWVTLVTSVTRQLCGQVNRQVLVKKNAHG